MRKGHKHFRSLGPESGDYTTAEGVISPLLEHPKRMRRPIAVRGDRGLIAAPSERVLERLD